MKFSTKQIHGGVDIDPVTGSILTPIFQTTTYVQPSVDEYLSKGFSYSRTGNPTVRALEKRLTLLEEGADTVAFGTGMAAIQATMMALLNAGDHCIVSDVAYGGTYRFTTKVLARFGIEFTFADTSKPEEVEAAVRDNTRLIFTETPANPTMKLTDIAAISEIARKREIPHAVDNTFLTPYYQQPLKLGADLSVHSTTKYFDGHNATVGGAVVSNTKELDEQIRFVQGAMGTIMSPMGAWLTLQGCKTLSIRMDKQSANAMAVARFLEKHPKVRQVCYPGLESFAQHDLARRQATGFGAMLWFDVEGGVAAGKKLMDNIEVWTLAENLGSVESLVTHPVTMTHAAVDAAERERVGITDGLVRLSVGLEDEADLVGALEDALAKI
jgi:cystathionine gamma-lyase/cystathionine beta-lyase/cystathionine gamma-lyase/homocysteine desulfhydrase